MMTNEAFKEAIDTYGDRIFCLFINNDRKILLGYNSSPKLSDIELCTIGGLDAFKIRYVSKSTTPVVEYETLYLTEYIESIGIMSEKDINYRVDPLTYR